MTEIISDNYAKFSQRFMACFFDCIIIFVFYFILFKICVSFGLFDYIDGETGFAVNGTSGFEFHFTKFTFPNVIAAFVSVIPVWLYFALMESSGKRATIGKNVVGIFVTDLEGKRITFLRSTARHFSKILSSIFGIGYIMIAITKKKQGLHDIMAGCLVQFKCD